MSKLRFANALLLIAMLMAATTARAAEPAKRLPIPTDEQQERAKKLVQSIYEQEFKAAVTAADKTALAATLFKSAEELNDDPAGRYILLVAARTQAIAAGDAAQS